MRFDRRTLIRSAGQLAILGAFAPVRVLAAMPGAYPFTLGVAAGDPWPDGFVIFSSNISPPKEHPIRFR